MRCARAVWMAFALALLVVNDGRGQLVAGTGPASPPTTTEGALHAMAQQAAAIFTGQVVAVRRVDGRNGANGVVEIEFAVDDAVRGLSGGTYKLREWAGLWAGNDQRFVVGQRYLMLLHGPSAAGLSSPVGGMDGAIPIRGGGPAPAEVSPQPASWLGIPAGRATRVSAAADGRVVDLRWVATRVVRAVSYSNVAHPTALPVAAHADVVSAGPARGTEVTDGLQAGGVTATLPAGAGIVAGAHDADYATVLALLRSWEKSGDGAR